MGWFSAPRLNRADAKMMANAIAAQAIRDGADAPKEFLSRITHYLALQIDHTAYKDHKITDEEARAIATHALNMIREHKETIRANHRAIENQAKLEMENPGMKVSPRIRWDIYDDTPTSDAELGIFPKDNKGTFASRHRSKSGW